MMFAILPMISSRAASTPWVKMVPSERVVIRASPPRENMGLVTPAVPFSNNHWPLAAVVGEVPMAANAKEELIVAVPDVDAE